MWSAEQKKEIVAAYGAESALVLAKRFGATRNAIIGVWHRARAAGLLTEPAMSRPEMAARACRAAKANRASASPIVAVSPRLNRDRSPVPQPPVNIGLALAVPRPTETAIPLLSPQLTTDHCRYSLWADAEPPEQKLYCGAEVVFGTSWCPACHDRVFKRRAA